MAEEWKTKVLSRYREQRARNGRSETPFGRSLRPLQFTATMEYLRIVDRAAQRVGVNRSTFYRRSAAVVAAAILGIDVRAILIESPRPSGYGEHRLRVDVAGARDTGEGIEKWCPHPGCDGHHLTH